MLFVPKNDLPLEQLANRIRLAAEPSARLMDDVIAGCGRLALLKQTGNARQFEAHCNSGAWVDAALALVATELPTWSVRRLVRDGDLWLCSLSRSPGLPIELDDVVETSHENLALAILLALVQAKLANTVVSTSAEPADTASFAGYRICCDNFA